VRYSDSRGQIIAEVDLLLENGDKRKLLGAEARAIASAEAKAYAVKQDLAAKVQRTLACDNQPGYRTSPLEQVGDTVKISVLEGFKLREW
jgi:hypothetical protein